MRLRFTEPFRADYAHLPAAIQERIDRQLTTLLDDPRHPSLQIRKLRSDPRGKTWYGRITDDHRFTFEIQGDVYVLRRVGKHELIE